MPASVTSSVLRLPRPIRRAYLGALSNPIVLFVHPWEFVDLRREKLRLDCRFKTGDIALACVRDVLASYVERGARFVRMREPRVKLDWTPGRRRAALVGGWLIATALLVVCARTIDWTRATDLLATTRPAWIVAAIMLNAAIVPVTGAFWMALRPTTEPPVSVQARVRDRRNVDRGDEHGAVRRRSCRVRVATGCGAGTRRSGARCRSWRSTSLAKGSRRSVSSCSSPRWRRCRRGCAPV